MFSHLVESYFQTSEEDVFCFALPCPQPRSQLGGWCTSGTDIKKLSTHGKLCGDTHFMLFNPCIVNWFTNCAFVCADSVFGDSYLSTATQLQHCAQVHSFQFLHQLSPNLCLRMWRIADTNNSEYDSSMMMITGGQKILGTLKTTCWTLVQLAMTL